MTDIYGLTVLKARNSRLRFQQGWLLLIAVEKSMFHGPTWLLVLCCNIWYSSACKASDFITTKLSPLCLPPNFLSYKDTTHWIRTHSNDLILTVITPSSNKVTFWDTKSKAFNTWIWGASLTQNMFPFLKLPFQLNQDYCFSALLRYNWQIKLWDI